MMKKTIFLLTGLILSFTAQGENINFADSHVKALCVQHWDDNNDGEISKDEAATITSLGTVFAFDETIVSFNELRYFTGLEKILSSEFYGCSALTNIMLPDQVESIGGSAFYDCTALKAIEIPTGVTTIENYAFNGCILLETLTLHEGLETIGDNAFNYCKSLRNLDIPSTVTSISVSAFKNCASLNTISVDADNTIYDSRNGCNAIIETNSKTLFLGAASTVVPSTVTTIGANAFNGNLFLRTIVIPEGVQTIGNSAFSGCTALTTAELPGTLTSVGTGAFSGCKNLSQVKLHEGLKTINTEAFYNCTSLKKVRIPSTVTKIGDKAFQCSSMTKVAVDFTKPITISSTAFPTRKKATLYVPEGYYNTFKSASVWKEFSEITEQKKVMAAIVEPEELEHGDVATITVSLENDDYYDYGSFQMDITLPQGFTFDANSIVLSDRCTGMQAVVQSLENNVYRLTCSSTSVTLTETEGTLFTVSMNVGSNAANGDHEATFGNIILVGDGSTQVTVPDTNASWAINSFQMGDVNHDGCVDIYDVTLVISYVLGQEVTNFDALLADVNLDEDIDIYDITMIIDIVLKQ